MNPAIATFLALLQRDLLVASRHAVPLLTATLAQPVLVVVVFGNVMPRLGLVSDHFGAVMIPGLMAITMLMAGVQGVLMPLSIDLSGSREVDERLLAPIPVGAVAAERVVAGAIHAALAGLVAMPAMMYLMHRGGIEVRPNWLYLLPLVVMNGLLSASFGLAFGSRIPPRASALLFPLVVGPMMLFGCAYYPWSSLAPIGPARFLVLGVPLTFMSEAMRLAVTPDIPHMDVLPLLVGLTGWTAFFATLGARFFERRTIL